MKVVVSGGNGFIGSHLVKYLLPLSQTILIPPSDIYEEKKISPILEGADCLIHLAGISSISACEGNIEQTFHANLALPCYLAESLYRKNPQAKFIFSSTGQVYDPKQTSPYFESDEVKPDNIYALSKLAAEKALFELAKNRNGKLMITRLFNVSHKTQSPTFFLPTVYDQILKSRDEKVKIRVGNVQVKRDFLALADILSVLTALVIDDSFSGQRVVNLCSGVEKQLEALILGMGVALGKKIEIVEDPSKVRSGEAHSMFGSSLYYDPKVFFRKSQSIQDLVSSFLDEVPDFSFVEEHIKKMAKNFTWDVN